MESKKSALPISFVTLITVFFFWGFVAASNGILIPLFKKKLLLSQMQAQLIDLAFYGAYFIGSILYFIAAGILKQDPLNKMGFKNGIVYGLLFSAFGALFFYPAAELQSFNLLLTALFLVGLGFSLQQTAAQPFVIAVGEASTGAQRLNLAGGINNLGTTLGPVLISYAIFGTVNNSSVEAAEKAASISSVKIPYLMLAVSFVLVALVLKFSKLPEIKNDEKIENGLGALKYPQLILGMIAIFVYVGVEVSIGSNLGEFLKQEMKLEPSQISPWVSLFWASMMIGRWSGSVAAFEMSDQTKKILMFVVPFIAFGVYLFINVVRGIEIQGMEYYCIPILIMIFANFASKDKPARTQIIFSALGMLAMLIGLFSSGKVALFAFLSGGLACSVLWPCIFNLAIAGLGKYTSQASSLLIMMILGGAIIPVLQGGLSDYIGIQQSYWLAFACFAYLAWFGIVVQGILKKQGIDYESTIGSSH